MNNNHKATAAHALRRFAALTFQYSLNISYCIVTIYYMKSAKG